MAELDPRVKGRELLNGLRQRTPALHQAFGETGLDIMTGHLAHLKNQDVREVITLIGLSRSDSLGSRFVGGMELTRETEKILRILISSPNTYNRRARRLKIDDIEKAVGEGRLSVDYSKEIAAARSRRAAILDAVTDALLDSIAS
ncbi:MAG TPA: hypothetical protein VJG66_00715 [Patescibacteria group bacterium]|nr:hypothetical protein [Patescibacteria group bacterium]